MYRKLDAIRRIYRTNARRNKLYSLIPSLESLVAVEYAVEYNLEFPLYSIDNKPLLYNNSNKPLLYNNSSVRNSLPSPSPIITHRSQIPNPPLIIIPEDPLYIIINGAVFSDAD